jgi:hypothetical protein
MSGFLLDPSRWKDRTDQASLAERAAGQAIRSLDKPVPLSAAQLTRIAAQIRADRSSPRPGRFWLTATVAVLLCGGTAAFAAHMNILPRWVTGFEKPRPIAVPTTRPSRPKAGVPARVDVPAPKPIDWPDWSMTTEPSLAQPSLAGPSAFEPESVAPMGKDKVFEPAQPRVAPRRSAAKPLDVQPVLVQPVLVQPLLVQPVIPVLPLPPPPSETVPAFISWPSPSPSAESVNPPGRHYAWVERRAETKRAEPAPVVPVKPADASPPSGGAESPTRYLTEAVRALRVEHSPLAALALLDRYAPRLDNSAFRHEALLLRVEALLKLNRQPDVLRLLDATPLAGVAASRTLLLTRAELRAAAGHCPDSLDDFDRVLAQTDGHDRRALLGRAKCRKQLGDAAGAHADVERYRREFTTQR